MVLQLKIMQERTLKAIWQLYSSPKELASLKSQNNANSGRPTVKRKYLTTYTKLLIGMKICTNFSLVAILIRLSGVVETIPGPFNFEIKECYARRFKVCHLNMSGFT